MREKHRFLALILLLSVAFGPLAAKGSLEELAWLAGHWRGEQGGMRMEEWWTEPAGGLMLGLHRDVRGSGGAFFEFLRIEEGDAGTFYLASPGGKPPVQFRLVESGDRRVVFENAEHDFPQRILYWIDGEQLRARIERHLRRTILHQRRCMRLEPAPLTSFHASHQSTGWCIASRWIVFSMHAGAIQRFNVTSAGLVWIAVHVYRHVGLWHASISLFSSCL